MAIETTRALTATKVAGAYAFFATLYFVQSVGDPTSGLVAQPVRSLLKTWGESPAELAALMALLAVPWTIKPIFGLLSDFVPLFGSRRRNYLPLANALAAASLLMRRLHAADARKLGRAVCAPAAHDHGDSAW